jgi:transcriptional regulator with XRE-family HTH domain
MTFALRLTEIMAARRMNQSDVARALRLTPQAVGQWLRGETNPTGAKIKRIAEALSVTEADLMSPVGSPIPDFSPAPTSEVAPKKPRLVDQPDQLALLEFWDDLRTDEARIRVFRILRAAAEPASKRS